MLRRQLIRSETKVIDAARGEVRAVMSDESTDREGDVIRQAFWSLDNFLKHPILLVNHDYYSIQSQIGEWTDVAFNRPKNRLEGVARYYIGDGNAEADWAYKLAEKGRAAYSVGFIPDMDKAKQIDGSSEWMPQFEFRGQELLETSQVTVPANANALQLMARSIGDHRIDPVIAGIITESLADLNHKQMEQPTACYWPGCPMEAFVALPFCPGHLAEVMEETTEPEEPGEPAEPAMMSLAIDTDYSTLFRAAFGRSWRS